MTYQEEEFEHLTLPNERRIIFNEVLDTNMKLNPITLSFSGELANVEEKFLDDYFIRSINQMRSSVIKAI